MAFPAGWDRYGRWTLRFADPELERSYQYADQAEGIRRVRTASLGAIVVWVIVAIIGPSSLDIPPGIPWAVSAVMIVVLLISAALTRWAVTQRRREAIGLGQQLAACVAALVLTASSGVFAQYAMPGVMLTAIFGFSVTRHPFVGSIFVGTAYVALFVAFALAVGLGRELILQVFVVAAAAAAACAGAYLLERSQRVAFTQAQLVYALHERVDALLHQYLSPDVAASLIEDPARAALGGRELEVTVLFADLRGYTSFSERRSPAEVVAMLNAAFGVAVPVLLHEGGTVVQFMGDAVMAIFNAPKLQADHALRAARAALGMQRAVEGLADAGARPRFRVGLNTGPALVGNIGAAAIRTYSAIGDTTNLAARLQAWAPEGSVVTSHTTYMLVQDHVVARSMGSPELKGKSVAVEGYELLGLRPEVMT